MWRIADEIVGGESTGELKQITYFILLRSVEHYEAGQAPTLNLMLMMETINIRKLPKTFQQALRITQELREKYLWIDSLCIIQDCPEDWKRDSADMGQVYSNSYLNISATATKDGSEGLFFNIQPERAWQVSVQFGKDLYYAIRPDFWHTEVVNSPLNRRAWECQERMLSPRNLQFGLNQIFWECSQDAACETFPEALPEPFPKPGSKFKGASIKQTVAEFLRAESSSDYKEGCSKQERVGHPETLQISNLWIALVTLYTSASLTYSRDKLVAIGGLAALMQRILSAQPAEPTIKRKRSLPTPWIGISSIRYHISRWQINALQGCS
jgi:hypothetical protein